MRGVGGFVDVAGEDALRTARIDRDGTEIGRAQSIVDGAPGQALVAALDAGALAGVG